MLVHSFPTTDEGAKLYDGFMLHEHCFCKFFENKSSLKATIKSINIFLESNGYEKVDYKDFDDTNSFRSDLVTIEPYSHDEKFIIYINRNPLSDSQTIFLINELKKFRDERDWEQFHNPKDLSIALNIETSELLELFLWKDHTKADKKEVKKELADIFSYALLLLDKYELNLEEIVLQKIKENSKKYPVDKARGSSDKYTKL